VEVHDDRHSAKCVSRALPEALHHVFPELIAARDPNRRTHPRAVVCGPPARLAAGRTPQHPPATSAITMPITSATSSRQARTNAGSSAWLTRHRAHRSRGTKIFRQRPTDRKCRWYPDQNTSGPAHAGQSGRGDSSARPARAYASTASGHGHTMATGGTASDPFSRRDQTKARRDSPRSKGDATILARTARLGSNMNKEHGRAPQRGAQAIRPSTTLTAPAGSGRRRAHDRLTATQPRTGSTWTAPALRRLHGS